MSTALTARILTTLATAALATSLTASASFAGVTSWTLNSASLQTASDIDGYFWRDYDGFSPTVFATPIPDGLHIVGGASDSDDRTVVMEALADDRDRG